MGTAASVPYDEETLKKLRGVITMRYFGTESPSAVPMRDGVEMVFECATEEQVVEVPQTVLTMVYGQGHEDKNFHNRAPPLPHPNELEGEPVFQKREKSLEALIQAQYHLDSIDKDTIGFISEMPPIHPLRIDRRQRARLMKSDGNLPRALERTKIGIEEQKRRELVLKKKKKELPPGSEPSWDDIQADNESEEMTQAGEGKKEAVEKVNNGAKSKPKTQESKAANHKTGKGSRNGSKDEKRSTSDANAKNDNDEKGRTKIEKEKTFNEIATNKERSIKETYQQKERQRNLQRDEELKAQRTQERLLHIINDF